jgi:hypothetical protein
VTADADQGKIYGNADPALGYTLSGLGNGAAFVGARSRFGLAPVCARVG